MNIDKILKEHQEASDKVSSLDQKIEKHFLPIIAKLVEGEDKEGLEKLLNQVPECYTRMAIYGGLRDIKHSIKA